jgi:hypothetical protein
MAVTECLANWRKIEPKENSAAEQRFPDVSEVFYSEPADVDPTGEWFMLDRGAVKAGGGDLRVWLGDSSRPLDLRRL